MKAFFSKRTVQAQWWCPKCMGQTMHEVREGLLGECLRCEERWRKEKEYREQIRKLSTSLKGEQIEFDWPRTGLER